MISLGAAGVLTFALAACGGSTAGSGSPAGNAAASGGSSSSSDSSDSGGSVEPASSADDLASTLTDATSGATSVHLVLDSAGGGAASAATSGEGDVKTGDDGKAEAFSISAGTGATAVTVVYVDGTGYVKLPTASQTDPSKPWAKVSDTSSNPVVKALSASFDQLDSQTSLTQYGTLVEKSSNFKATGAADVDGTAVQGYSFDVDPKDLPNAAQFGSAISELGPIPTTLAVDEKGRPVQLVQKITISGGPAITTTVTLSDYGKDVDISAPPADQISAE